MRPVVLLIAAVTALAGVGCGSEIGDSCVTSTDCEQSDATRICDNNSDGGYCTIVGCDFGTCPKESECVRFFTGVFDNKLCSPDTEDCVMGSCPADPSDSNMELPATNDCDADELCALDGHCVTRSSELRYCMRSCGSTGDCRSGYECRDGELMKMHGGEPVPPPGQRLGSDLQAFCAQAPAPTTTTTP